MREKEITKPQDMHEQNAEALVSPLLLEMKEYIKKGTLHKSDLLYNIFPDEFRIEETRGVALSIYAHDLKRKGEMLKEGTYYDLVFAVYSERYQIQRCYLEKGESVNKHDILALDMAQIAKERFIDAMESEGLEKALEKFKIMQKQKYWTYARSTDLKELNRIQYLLSAFVTLKRGLDLNKKEFNFIRESKKKKTDDPACFDGSCLEKNILNGKISIFGREVR